MSEYDQCVGKSGFSLKTMKNSGCGSNSSNDFYTKVFHFISSYFIFLCSTNKLLLYYVDSVVE